MGTDEYELPAVGLGRQHLGQCANDQRSEHLVASSSKQSIIERTRTNYLAVEVSCSPSIVGVSSVIWHASSSFQLQE